MIKVWMDDYRDPKTYDGDWERPYDRASKVLWKYGRDWVWVKTVEEAKEVLAKGNIEVLSCDNSLGMGFAEGYTLLDWLEEKAATNPVFPIPTHLYVHSSDSNRVSSMQATITNIQRFQKK